jgi:hypothetical protein
MKIVNVRPGNGKAKVCTFDLEIEKWGNYIMPDLSYFKKENNSWVNFYSREYEKDGKKKFYEIGRFKDPEMTKSFKEKAKDLIEKWLQENPFAKEKNDKIEYFDQPLF